MSAQAAARVAPRPRPTQPAAPATAAPRLLLVRAPAQARARVPFVMVCIAILVGALVAALLLNTTMARGAYEKHALERELAALASTQQDQAAAIELRSSPQQLATAARALGMEQARSVGWVRLSDASIQGVPAVGESR